MVRAFSAAAAYHELNVRDIDLEKAFLYGELEENVYMKHPEGYIEKKSENKIFKHKKSIYGPKQSDRKWHEKIETSLKQLNFTQSTADSCVFTRKEKENSIYIIVYINDILIAGENQTIDN